MTSTSFRIFASTPVHKTGSNNPISCSQIVDIMAKCNLSGNCTENVGIQKKQVERGAQIVLENVSKKEVKKFFEETRMRFTDINCAYIEKISGGQCIWKFLEFSGVTGKCTGKGCES